MGIMQFLGRSVCFIESPSPDFRFFTRAHLEFQFPGSFLDSRLEHVVGSLQSPCALIFSATDTSRPSFFRKIMSVQIPPTSRTPQHDTQSHPANVEESTNSAVSGCGILEYQGSRELHGSRLTPCTVLGVPFHLQQTEPETSSVLPNRNAGRRQMFLVRAR